MNNCKTCGNYVGAHALPVGKYEYQEKGFCSPSCALIPELRARGKRIGSNFFWDMDWQIIELNGKRYQVNFEARYVYEMKERLA